MLIQSNTVNDEYHTADVATLKTQVCTSYWEGMIGQPGYAAFATAVQACDGGKC